MDICLPIVSCTQQGCFISAVFEHTNFFPVKIYKKKLLIHYTFIFRKFTHIDGDKVDLGVAVLPRLRGGHVNDFAGPPFYDNVSATKNRTD